MTFWGNGNGCKCDVSEASTYKCLQFPPSPPNVTYSTQESFETTQSQKGQFVVSNVTRTITASTVKMPRQGDGSGDNAIEAGHNIIHGAGPEKVSSSQQPRVIRSSANEHSHPLDHPRQPRGQDGTDARVREGSRS